MRSLLQSAMGYFRFRRSVKILPAEIPKGKAWRGWLRVAVLIALVAFLAYVISAA
jgi:hypothetical protein